MLQRWVERRLRRLLRRYPAVALMGPRQSGKTTLARRLGGMYFDLEQEADRLRLDVQWKDVAGSRGMVILDEAQADPAVFPRLRGAIDADRRRSGRFLLLGSVSPALMRNVSESLAGRLALCELTPFILKELPGKTRSRFWLTGGYPSGGILKPSDFPEWQGHYLALLAQRDLPNWGLPARPQLTMRFLKMLAAAHGSVWNASQMGQNLGLSYHTVNHYLDYLEGAYLVRRLMPFHANMRKRLVKSPKIFWRDSGLLHALLGVRSHDALLSHPKVGASWEGFAIEQILAHLDALGKSHDAFYLRTSDGHELDLVLELSGMRWAFEIKLTSSPRAEDFHRLQKVAALIRADRCVMISQTSRADHSKEGVSTNLEDALDLLATK